MAGANPFDRFDAPSGTTVAPAKVKANPFDRFDAPTQQPSQQSWLTVEPIPDTPTQPGIDYTRPVHEVRKAIAGLPEKDRPAAMKAWADAFVKKEHEDSPIWSGIDDKVRQFARGTPVGSWLDELSAKTSDALGFAPYDEAKAYQDARDRYADDNSTKLGTLNVPLLGPVDVTTGGLVKLAGGAASMPMAPLPGMAGRFGLLGGMAKNAGAGAGYGALYGAGEGNTTGERIGNAGTGALFGGALGGVAPPIATGVGNAVGWAAKNLRPNPAELRGVSRTAIEKVLPHAESDMLLTPGQPLAYENQAARMGGDAMIADMGHNLRKMAGGLATKPQLTGEIARPILNRAEGATGRLDDAVTRAMGRPLSVPDMIDNLVAQGRENASPLYKQFEATQIKPTDRLVNLLQRVPQSAYDKAANLMRMEGVDPASVNGTGRFIDLIKRGLDDVAQGEVDKFNRTTNTGRVYNNLARDLTDEVDRILSPNNPAQSVWAQARRASKSSKDLQKAFEDGQKAFSKSLSYDQMMYNINKMSPMEQQMYRMGARSQIYEVMDTSGNRSGSSAATAGMKTLGSLQADKKLRAIAARPEDGVHLSLTRDAEAAFANTNDVVLRNSETASRQEHNKMFKLDANDTAVHNVTMEGLVLGPAKALANVLTQGAVTANRLKIATDAARMLVAQGARRDEIVAGLREYQRRNGVTLDQRKAITALITSLMAGTRPATIDSRTRRH